MSYNHKDREMPLTTMCKLRVLARKQTVSILRIQGRLGLISALDYAPKRGVHFTQDELHNYYLAMVESMLAWKATKALTAH